MRDFTDISVLVDRSGSMTTIKTAMESAFDEFLIAHRAIPTTRLTLIQFDGSNNQQMDYSALPIAEAGKLVLNPRGSTPLLDALCIAIDNTGTRLANMPERDRPKRVLFVVITDGEENASRLFKRADVKQRIERQQGAYNWQFTFLGANQDAFGEAATYGLNPWNVLNYSPTYDTARAAMKGMTGSTLSYAAGQEKEIRYMDVNRVDSLTVDEQWKATVPQTIIPVETTGGSSDSGGTTSAKR